MGRGAAIQQDRADDQPSPRSQGLGAGGEEPGGVGEMEHRLKRQDAVGPSAAALGKGRCVAGQPVHGVAPRALAGEGDLAPFEALLAVIGDPYQERAGLEAYALPAPEAFVAGFRTFCGT